MLLLTVGGLLLWAGHEASQWVLAAGGVGLFVAVTGRCAFVCESRYEDRPLAQPPHNTHHSSRRRLGSGRASGIAYAGGVLGVLMVLAAVVSPGDRLEGLAFTGFGLAVMAGCWLAGPAARFVVTPAYLTIDTAFYRIRVPRRLLGEFTRSQLEVRLHLTNGDFYDLSVDSPLWGLSGADRYRLNSRCQVRTVARIVAMLSEVRAEDPDPGSGVVTGLRRGTVAFAGIAVVVCTALTVIGTVDVFRLGG
ncbi:hypothetical protein [Winogradskya humida]|uniref:PH (Pleckstrin Homology) domain-containing protein n=1 Tax=Winogradskya humida TaxID=113566 RepID=A0ABQ3ZUV9_9ACTN|nr:hypothetical protein [Actinoplanes humidus]GIE22369.1 hypothetical protein Ahu01nite_054710 [Actinoplanes humidus]